jgi:hypothetical protein
MTDKKVEPKISPPKENRADTGRTEKRGALNPEPKKSEK